MPPPDAVSADTATKKKAQEPEAIASAMTHFFERHPQGVVLEDGKALFELETAKHHVAAEHGRCTLQLWSGEKQLVRTVVGAVERGDTLRLSTQRFGHPQTKALVLAPALERREPNRREPERQGYLRLLQRVLAREFPKWQPDAFRAAMDLERSFGPAYARGSLVRGNEAWAVIGVSASETQPVIDGILTLGVLWLHHCRERSDGRRLYKGLRIVVPRGAATLTLARLPWMNTAAAQWELHELEERTEDLLQRDPADQGNLRTRLVHLPDQAAAKERFAPAIEAVMALVPKGEERRVEQRLRSTAELAFLLHGLEFARARISLAPGSFGHTLEITVGVGASETVLTPARQGILTELVAELFQRRSAAVAQAGRSLRPHTPGRGIGTFTGRPAHTRIGTGVQAAAPGRRSLDRLEQRERALAAQQDPLFRASPERWLESVLRENLAPLTRSLAPSPLHQALRADEAFANDLDPDTRGNRATPEPQASWLGMRVGTRDRTGERLISRFDGRFVYTQVPAIAGAGDRGMLDLLGMTEDGRLAVIELKASDDLQLVLQGLDYWIRVRHHHAATQEVQAGQPFGTNDLQHHGYFRGAELSPDPPRLYLVAPALRIHPATETILRYLSARVEWTLLALDERWRQEVRVVWSKSGGQPAA